MRISLRVVSTVMVFVGTWALCSIVLLVLPLGVFGIIGSLAALVVAFYAARRAWRASEHGPDSALGTAVMGAAIVGGIGFAAGFFGPMIFAPQANQGPLLGIFITGPAGVVLGALGGYLYGLARAGR
jgi:hypothetical protein